MTLPVYDLEHATSRVGMPLEVRAVQVDLGRQMETVATLCDFIDFATTAGFNTLVLYLEDRLRTASYPHRSTTESYSPAELTAVVAHARARGMAVVPALNALGHAEHFMAHAAMLPLAEERDGDGRFGAARASTFDWSLPATEAFWSRYLDEVCAVFDGPVLHMGLDECWNLGHSPTNRPRLEALGLGGVFMDVVQRLHAMATARGKRLWIWDDMFEFFPEQLAELPRDVVLCHWAYETSMEPEGPIAHFADRERHDWLGRYEALGLDALICPWGPENTRSFTRHAQGKRLLGGLYTQWEMTNSFLDLAKPQVAFAGALWRGVGSPSDRDPVWQAALAQVLPTLSPAAKSAIRMLAGQGGGMPTSRAQGYLGGATTIPELNRAAAVELACTLLEAEPAPTEPQAAAIFADYLDSAQSQRAHWQLRELAPAILDLQREPAAVPALAARLAAITETLSAVAARRRGLHDTRRPGMHPVNGTAAQYDAILAMLADLRDRLQAPPPTDERRLLLRLDMPDQNGGPRLRVTAVAADGSRVQAYEGSPKNPGGEHIAGYTLVYAYRSEQPPVALELEAWGWGDVGLSYLEVQDHDGRLRPTDTAAADGPIQQPDALLHDDSAATRLGVAGYRASILEPERAQIRAKLQVNLARS